MEQESVRTTEKARRDAPRLLSAQCPGWVREAVARLRDIWDEVWDAGEQGRRDARAQEGAEKHATMSTPQVCMRCGRVTVVVARGALWLCVACPLQPPCDEYQHDYRAAPGDTPGVWVCLQCGQLLMSQKITSEDTPTDGRGGES